MTLKTRSISIFALLGLAIFFWSATSKSGPPADLLYHPGSNRIVSTDPDGEGPLPAGDPRLEGSLVIDFVDGFSPQQLRDFQSELGIEPLYHSVHSLESALTVADVPEADMGELIRLLESDERVEAVAPNYVYSLYDVPAELGAQSEFPNDPELKFQWHLDQINCRDAWRWTSGQGVVVAVIDTGVAYADSEDGVFHRLEDLEQTRFTEGYDFIHRRSEAYDDHCHGSHVAGTVAQSTHNGKGVGGVAFGSTVMPVKVLSARGGGTNAGVADGIRFAADHGAKVLNLSLGGPGNSSVLDVAVAHAVKKGSLVVCAAGNSNRSRPGYPAGCEGAISVSALDFEENLAFYSNYGPSISIAAPGGDTRSDKNGDGKPDGVYQNTIKPGNPGEGIYANFQGTSMASPHAAGVFALGASLGVTKQEALQALVYKTARPAPEGGKEGYGAGIIDAGALAHQIGYVYGLTKLILGLLVGLLAFAFYLRRRQLGSIAMAVPGILAGSCGLLWWVPAFALNEAPLNPLLVNGIPAWDLFLLGVDQHGSFLTHSALIPLAFCFAASALKFLRPLAAGFAAGVAGHLVFVAAYGVLEMPWLPANLQELWLAANAFLCVALCVACAAKK